MCQALAGLALAVVASITVVDAVSRESLIGLDEAPGSHPVVALDPALRAGLERIASRSGLWRQALEAVRATGRYAVVVTPEQLRSANGLEDEPRGPDSGVLAEVAPVLREGRRVTAALVVVNVPLIERIHLSKGSLPGEFQADLDRILIHEIYGHAVPYLIAGDLSGRCADPAPNERASDACAIRRENAVRAELRLGRRTDAGLSGLALARSLR